MTVLPSYSRVPTRAGSDTQLSAPALRLLIALGRYVGRNGECFPGLGTLAKESAISRGKVSVYIAELEARGYLLRERRKKGEHHMSNLYTLIYDGVVPQPGTRGSPPFGDYPVSPTRDHPSPPSRDHGSPPFGDPKYPTEVTHLSSPAPIGWCDLDEPNGLKTETPNGRMPSKQKDAPPRLQWDELQARVNRITSIPGERIVALLMGSPEQHTLLCDPELSEQHVAEIMRELDVREATKQ